MDERLAAGGMGEVWKGFDTRLGRNVAIKILHAGLSSNDKFRARFQLEARAVAALQSPGIVALYDYGEETGDEGLVSYLVMELVAGRSLADILRDRGTLPPDEVMKIVATAADALETAHRADIIHRDIKPANLLVDESGTVKIVDFGIASARGASGLTETGTVMGTLAYASPEQLNGAELTGATDLYSLGIVAYEALMGQPPFVSDTPVAVMNGHMTQAPPPLSRDIPPGVAQVVLQALQKDPKARYTSASEMARSAREGRVVTGGIPVSPPSTPADGSTQLIGADATHMLGGGNTPRSITAAQPTGAIGPDGGDTGNRAVPWLITGGVTLVVILILVLIFGPWGKDDPGGEITDTETTSTPAETDSPSPTEDETTEAEETKNWDDDSDWEPTTDEPMTDDESTPAEDESTPADEESTPAGDESTNPDDESTPPGGETTPPDDETTPADGGTTPAGGGEG
ncbi:serine/threonine-protein kinase [Glycomyces arizonensis]|uniref:serine/threonine-protein kinase n=1 Tax=Glycomyces arizonensis TaxID=256035 RepID=UPI0012EC3F71|nr:serine/threonine-protein kinase [Glycomyces arizonensis]